MLTNNSQILRIDFRLKYHVLFWILYFLLNFLRWGAYYDDYIYSFKSNLVEFSLHIAFIYFNIFILIPRFILKSRYISYIFIILFCLGLIYVLKTFLILFLISEDIWPEANIRYQPFGINHIISECVGELYVLTLASSVYLTMNWLRERERNRKLREEQIKIKLKNFENQIQPHFFFNTLNNLYSLSISNSDLVSSVIIKLSKLMKFVLYDVKDNSFVPLVRELEYIQNYIDIERLRFKNIEVITSINSNIEHIFVPPMIFITFIENAFKHGGYKGIIKIKINCNTENDQYFVFEVINNYVNSKEAFREGGIGIENVINRLKLLYQNEFELSQTSKLNYYIVKLKIPVNYEN
ncbi:sensor histidine kinase [Chryseobacterium populi]|uniref:Putative regulator of cell autolysis n=1 Tax=Chryseobacterium populi TaxID=1144316 RepID=J2SYU4_9FLAO|nr:sensor histidine kinase [Chryseobacterium populi]EJL70837.1 putative regulator of cell autolysis [Chryseobacterium populi]